tara:strand:- start:569 stop:811 length:243 start_codon:yes stop_codon:yes gene_type:complete
MKFEKIEPDMSISAGEYLWHEPTREVVLCGSYKKEEGLIRALSMSKKGMLEDKIGNFKKIYLSNAERKEKKVSRCKGCGG